VFGGTCCLVHQDRCINKKIGQSEFGDVRRRRTLSGPVRIGEALFKANGKEKICQVDSRTVWVPTIEQFCCHKYCVALLSQRTRIFLYV
jgi:hypothetical protein